MTNKIKLAVLGVAMSFGLTAGVSAASSSCTQWCKSYSWQMQATYCGSVNGGSACASSIPLNGHFYNQCVSNYCR